MSYKSLERKIKCDSCQKKKNCIGFENDEVIGFALAMMLIMIFICAFILDHNQDGNCSPSHKSSSDKSPRSMLYLLNSSVFLWNFPKRITDAVTNIEINGGGDNANADLCQVVANDTTTWNSIIHSNFSDLKKYDAVVFYIPELDPYNLPPSYYQQPEHQRYVFYTDESPVSMRHFYPEDFNNYFNWIMSYRSDSDIKILPRQVEKISSNSSLNLDPTMNFNQRPKKVAWIVSHCQASSPNEEYVRELRKYIDVDIYGSCGNLTTEPVASDCFRKDGIRRSIKTRCLANLTKDHKFYLSFEDSDCQDYVTDKFFNVLRHDLIPIVKGRANYSSIAPPNSFIDTARFINPGHLAEYLLDLDEDKGVLTRRYFEWKKNYRVGPLKKALKQGFRCDLCDRIRKTKGYIKKDLIGVNDTILSSYRFSPLYFFERKSHTPLLPKWSAVDRCK